MRPEFGKPSFLYASLTVLAKQVCMTKVVMFFSRNEMVLSSSLITAIIHARARFRSAALCGIAKQLLSIAWMSTL